MLNPIRAVMLATIVAWCAGLVVDSFVSPSSIWVLAAGTCGFMGTLAALALLGLRE